MSSATTAARPASEWAVYRGTRWSTLVEMIVVDPCAVVLAVELLGRELDIVEAVASRFRADSELNELHRAAAMAGGAPVPVSAELLEAISVGLRASRLTGGSVDPTVGIALCRLGYDRDFPLVADGVEGDLPDPDPVPGWRSVAVDRYRSTVAVPPGVVIDLGATAKAWAADRAAAVIETHIGCGVLVSLGGDLAVRSAPRDGFRVGIADICGDPAAPLAVSVTSGGLATSGIGNRSWMLGRHPVHHLIDPGTGLPVDTCWRTVSVAAGSCVDANTASTAAMVMSERAAAWLHDHHLPSRLVRNDGSTVVVAGWPADSDGPFTC